MVIVAGEYIRTFILLVPKLGLGTPSRCQAELGVTCVPKYNLGTRRKDYEILRPLERLELMPESPHVERKVRMVAYKIYKSLAGDSPVHALIGLAFCALLGVMVRDQGIAALLWTPLGFAIGLFSTSQMLLPLIWALPRAIWLARKRQMRLAVCGRILMTPLIWFVGLVLVGFLWPSVAKFLYDNSALNLGMWLGTVAIILSPLSAKSRRDFHADFDKAYGQFYRIGVTDKSGNSKYTKDII
jgi:hypothetical protein